MRRKRHGGKIDQRGQRGDVVAFSWRGRMAVRAQQNAEPRYRHDDARQNGAPARIDEILAEESEAGLALHHGIVHCSRVWINGLAYGSLSLSIRLLAAAGEHASCGHAYS